MEQAQVLQLLHGGAGMAAEEQFQHLVEQPRRRHLQQQLGQFGNLAACLLVQPEAQLGGEAGGAQHAHRVFPVALFGVADQADLAALDGAPAADKVVQREVGDIVVERIDGEVAAQGVFLDAAPGVVAQHQPGLFVGGVLVAVEFLVVPLKGAERGDFDHFAAETHMHDLEAAADDTAALEQALDLLRRGVGGHVEVLGVATQQEIANRATDQVALVAGLAQARHQRLGVGHVAETGHLHGEAGLRGVLGGGLRCFIG